MGLLLHSTHYYKLMKIKIVRGGAAFEDTVIGLRNVRDEWSIKVYLDSQKHSVA